MLALTHAPAAGGVPVEGCFHWRHHRNAPAADMAQPHVCRTGLSKSRPYKPGCDQNEPQLYKKQGNIMQDHRKSEETAFWAGLARSLCELQLTSKARSLAPNSAENIPSAAKDNTPHAFASGLPSRTPCT